jgi:hypothetical protein
VRLVRGADDDVAGRNDERPLRDPERRLAGLDDEHLGIWMLMKLRSDTGSGVDEDHRERDRPVVRPDELVRMRAVLELVEVDDVPARLVVSIAEGHVLAAGGVIAV